MLNQSKHAQMSDGWFKDHAGILTGSIMKTIMDGGAKAWGTLLDKKKAEVEDPAILVRPQVRAASLDWGNKYEKIAIANYELIYDIDVEHPSLVFHPSVKGVAASPDFYHNEIVGEVKCPYSEEIHAMTVLHGMGVDTYKAQIQTEIWVTEAEFARFISYDPRYPDPGKQIIIIDVKRDDDYLELMEEKCALFFNYLKTDTRPKGFEGVNQIPILF